MLVTNDHSEADILVSVIVNDRQAQSQVSWRGVPELSFAFGVCQRNVELRLDHLGHHLISSANIPVRRKQSILPR